MLKVPVLIISALVLILVAATVFKQYQRKILWSAAIVLFVGTLLLIGFGVIYPVGETRPNLPALTGIIMALVGAAALASTAEKLHFRNKGKQNEKIAQDPLYEQASNEAERVILTERLDTELARKIFARAIEAGFMEENGAHYKWKLSKALLAYMCGRIYCGDKSEYSDSDEKSFWKYGSSGFFPDTELSTLFGQSELGQSRQNRKDLTVPQKSHKIDKLFE
ncbi:MAG: hypothetical protein J6K95_02155 [Rikenellaceae bacterium]|nr:hypothetical protein [Rikenellaceae bacterium]